MIVWAAVAILADIVLLPTLFGSRVTDLGAALFFRNWSAGRRATQIAWGFGLFKDLFSIGPTGAHALGFLVGDCVLRSLQKKCTWRNPLIRLLPIGLGVLVVAFSSGLIQVLWGSLSFSAMSRHALRTAIVTTLGSALILDLAPRAFRRIRAILCRGPRR